MTRDEIITALEKAKGPDRKLDGIIALLVGHTTVSLSKHRYWSFNSFNIREGAPAFSWPKDPIPEFDLSTGKKIVLTEIPPSAHAATSQRVRGDGRVAKVEIREL